MLALVFGAVGIFALQVRFMGPPAPGSDGRGFFLFVLIEVGGGLVLGFYTLLRERARSLKQATAAANTKEKSL